MRRSISLDSPSVEVVGVDAPEALTLAEVASRLVAHWRLPGGPWRLEYLGYASSGLRLEPHARWDSLRPGGLVLTRTTPPAAHRRDVTLVVVTGPDAGRRIPVGAGQWRIGRGPGHDVVLEDPLLSRAGVVLTISARGVELASQFHALGEIISLGSSTLQVVPDGAPPRATEAWSVTPPARPRTREPRRFYLAGLIAPIVVAVILVAVTKMWLFLIIAAASPVTGALTWWFERRRARRISEQEEREWHAQDERARARVGVGLEQHRRASHGASGCLLGLGSVRAPIDIAGPWPSAPRAWQDPGDARRWQPAIAGAALVARLAETDIVLSGDRDATLAVARYVLSRERPQAWEVASERPEDFSFLSPYGVLHVDPRTTPGAGAIRVCDAIVGSRRDVRISSASRVREAGEVRIDVGASPLAGLESAELLAGAPDAFVPGPVAVGAMSVSSWLAHNDGDAGTHAAHGCRPAALESLLPMGPDDLAERWSRREGGARCLVGLTNEGPMSIDLVRHGPHALVGGTTGSGKSQFLETLAISLAATHHPRDLNLLLVDFKGGAAFGRIAGLPHVAGMLTNLDPHGTTRAIRTLDAELHRRQRLFSARGAKDLDDFRRLSDGAAPPRLVIVIDEFRAFAQSMPTLMEDLVALSGLGRSLGMHLILATQRPAGVVTADMRANIGLRVALRMRDAGDSLDVLESPAAASISADAPGRAYLRSDAEPETPFHAALVRGRADASPRDVRIGPPGEAALESVSPGAAFSPDAFLAAAGGHGAAPLWLPELPDTLPADPRRWWAAALADDPKGQRQHHVDLSAAGHTALIGSARSGRSRGVATLLRSGAHKHPGGAWYVVDTDRQLQDLAGHDQCAALVTGDEPWRIERVLALLSAEIRRRLEAGQTSPPLCLAIDGWEAFASLAEDNRRDWLAQVASIARSGATCGVRLLVSGDRKLMTSRLGQSLGTLLVFRHHDPQDVVFLGLTKADIPHRMPPGRALLVGGLGDAPPTLVHLVADAEIPPVRDASPRLRQLPLPRLRRRAGGGPGLIPLGLAGDQAEHVDWDPARDGHTLLVVAPHGSEYLADYWRQAAPQAQLVELTGLSRAEHHERAEALRARAARASGQESEADRRPIIVTAALDTLAPGSGLLSDLQHSGPRLVLGATIPSHGEAVGRRDLAPLPTTAGLGWYVRGPVAEPLQLYA